MRGLFSGLLAIFLRLKVTLLPSLLCACSTFRTHDCQFCQVNWLSVCFDKVALDTRDPQPARCCSSHANYHRDLNTRVPRSPPYLIARRHPRSSHRRLIQLTVPLPACLLLVRRERQSNSRPRLCPKVSSACYLPTCCARGLPSVAAPLHPACRPCLRTAKHSLPLTVTQPSAGVL
jgi:hypothetical protein